MNTERKRYYVELTGYALIILSILFSIISAALTYNPAGADPSALSIVIVSVVLMAVGVILVRFLPWGEPPSALDKADDDEFVF